MALSFKALVAAHLIVKNTFLDFEQEEQPVLRRSKSCPPERRPAEHYQVSEPEENRSSVACPPCCYPQLRSPSSSCSTKTGSRSSSPKASSSWEDCSSTSRTPRSQYDQARTSIMLRHMPNNYTPDMLLAMLDKEGFAGQYDFVYLPMDFRRKAGLGYAFVNLSDPAAVPRFWKTFEGYTRWDLPTRKVCELSWSAPLQGLDSHVRRFRNLPVMHPSVPEHFKPMLFQNGCRIPFPPPTKPLKAPFQKV